MKKVNIKAQLKSNITEEEFLKATFYDTEFDKGIYDIDKMKTKPLEGTEGEYSLTIHIPRIRDGYITFDYEKESKDIWDYEIIEDEE